MSLLIALTLGAILSWSLIRPVRRVDAALEQIAGGDFKTYVEVPNRDEFGNLTRNLNRTTDQLSALYQTAAHLNANLQETVETKVAELERTSRLRRYLSPNSPTRSSAANRTWRWNRAASTSPRSSPTSVGSPPPPNGWSRASSCRR